MPRYIDADAFAERLRDLVDWCSDLRKPGLEQALCMVHEQPTADVAPVVRGKWVEISDPKARIKTYTCSACRIAKSATNDVPFCPNCGARMDAERGGRDEVQQNATRS